MTSPIDRPVYVRELPENEIWTRLKRQHAEYGDLLQLKRETRSEAVGRKPGGDGAKGEKWSNSAPRWFDNDLEQDVRAWDLFPFNETVSDPILDDLFSRGRILHTNLKPRLDAQELTAALIREWGQFCAICGALELIDRGGTIVGRARNALAGGADNLHNHKRWFARYFLSIYRRPDREGAICQMEYLINSIVLGQNTAVPMKDAFWFQRFLSAEPSESEENHRRLTKAFLTLSASKMKRLIEEGTDGLPLLDLKFPHP